MLLDILYCYVTVMACFPQEIPPLRRPVSSSTPAADSHSPLREPYNICNVRGTRHLKVACRKMTMQNSHPFRFLVV